MAVKNAVCLPSLAHRTPGARGQKSKLKLLLQSRRCHPQELREVLRARLLAPALPFPCFVVSPRAAKRGAAEAIRASKSMA